MFKSVYLTLNTFYTLALAIVFFSFGLLWQASFYLGFVVILLLFIAIIVESILLFKTENSLILRRKLPKKLSNGDANLITLEVENLLAKTFQVTVIDNIPYQFRIYNFERKTRILPKQQLSIPYYLTPTLRGVYEWGDALLIFKLKKWSFVARKETFSLKEAIDCYPSFLQFKKLHLKAQIQSQEKNDLILKKIGQSLEFEQIKDYLPGDDYRHINWKASAKKGHLMLNQYQDELSQDIYCIVDTGRTMKMTSQGQSLLDCAINATLALSKAIITAKDKAGLLLFNTSVDKFISPKKDWRQFGKINEVLFNVETDYLESDFEYLYKFSRINIKRRSLIVLFTNFDSLNAMRRNFGYLKNIARHHLLVVVFFENAEITKDLEIEALNLKSIYEKSIGFDRLQQTKLISRELQNAGIRTVYSKPETLSAEVIKKYAEIKRQQIL